MSLTSRLQAAILRVSDLARHGGTIPETNRDNNFGSNRLTVNASGGWFEVENVDSTENIFDIKDGNGNLVARIQGSNSGPYILLSDEGSQWTDKNGRPFATMANPGGVTIKDSLGFGVTRQPNLYHATFVSASAQTYNQSHTPARVDLMLKDENDNIITQQHMAGHTYGNHIRGSASLIVPARYKYMIQNQADPRGSNSLHYITEVTL